VGVRAARSRRATKAAPEIVLALYRIPACRCLIDASRHRTDASFVCRTHARTPASMCPNDEHSGPLATDYDRLTDQM
jgi:hypothetical protein